jgi:hypothetical protein
LDRVGVVAWLVDTYCYGASEKPIVQRIRMKT